MSSAKATCGDAGCNIQRADIEYNSFRNSGMTSHNDSLIDVSDMKPLSSQAANHTNGTKQRDRASQNKYPTNECFIVYPYTPTSQRHQKRFQAEYE